MCLIFDIQHVVHIVIECCIQFLLDFSFQGVGLVPDLLSVGFLCFQVDSLPFPILSLDGLYDVRQIEPGADGLVGEEISDASPDAVFGV